MVGNATNFLMGICNVKILYLSEYTLEVGTYSRKQIPEFNNLVHLIIKTNTEVSWESLPALLKNCSKLETLVFEMLKLCPFVLQGFHLQFDNCPGWDTSTFLSSNPVTVLKILEFLGVIGDEYNEEHIKQIQLILERMPNLEQLTIYIDQSNEEDVLTYLPHLVFPLCFNFSSVQTVAPSSSFRILMSKSLVRLRVSGTDEFTIIDVGEVSFSLPKLNTLHMNDVGFADESGAAFAKLVSSCHALEELVMDKIMWDFRGSCSVSNSSLKRVTIYSENIDDEDPKSVSLSALPISL
ncbi:unnamed protein product [Brassica napus]|uniref:(rape) hypothetical protein n=1 Tax=Brassica napus TaxID=3708 RepID=A0A816PJB1_BRANA|nr:unnamed protein product [Brassica napus]